VELPSGTFTISNENGTLRVRTGREGLGARAGHDLTIEATRWQATVQSNQPVPRVTAEVDPRSFRVLEGTGGMKALTDDDRAEIKKNLERKVLAVDRHPRIAFQSSEWRQTAGEPNLRGVLAGELELHGQRGPLELEVELLRSDGAAQVHGRATVVQTRWGIKPYSALLGALKVADPVEVEIEAALAGI
jgi:polyisoprenoid-binding protein YceI